MGFRDRTHDAPAHHRAEEAVETYIAAAGLEDLKAPLFIGRWGGGPCWQRPAAGVRFRVNGVDELPHVQTLEHAQRIVGHASSKTTKLYDRTADAVSLDEIERIVI